MNEAPDPRERRARIVTALALLLFATLRLALMGDSHGSCRRLEVDDLLYARSADAIAEGRWLGDYHWTTHMKLPGYPAWLALLRLAGIPTLLGQELLLVAALLLLFAALRRVGFGRFAATLVFALLLWHPVAAWGNHGFLVRETIHHAQVLLIASALLLLLAPARDPARLVQVLILALATTFTWYTREESVWLVGVLAIGLAPALLLERRRAGWAAAARLVLAAIIPTVILIHATGTLIRELNEERYGARILVAWEDPDFRAAVGALMRAEPEPRGPHLPIRAETLGALMAASPALAEIRPEIESPDYRLAEYVDAEGNRITNFLSFLLAAAGSRQHGRSLPEAKAWYRRVGDELNAHLDRDRTRHGPRRDAVIPPLRTAQLPEIGREFLRLGLEMARPGSDQAAALPALPGSDCSPAEEALFRRVRRDPEEPSLSRWLWRTRLLQLVLRASRLVLPGLAILALAALLRRIARRRRQPFGPRTWAGVVLLLVALLRAGLCAAVNVVYAPLGSTYLVAGFLLFTAATLVLVLDAGADLPRPPLLASPLLGALALAGALAGALALGIREAGVPQRFLSAAEMRLVSADSPRDAIELHDLRGGIASGRVHLEVAGPRPSIHLWPWRRRSLGAMDLLLAGRVVPLPEGARLLLTVQLEGAEEERREILTLDPNGRFSARIDLEARDLRFARLEGLLKAGARIDLDRLGLATAVPGD